ncbi:LysR substrate-binding domain-containing protein [Streptomyces boninensis]|uniref:LysR substrate-binding domain-containing protein n=1 Tax=Streptomyces boninensis TaxID=2039455 RepID=UPI003B226A01
MELRDIEIFLRLAEELHFGRTAEQLHISQARVSQSIAKQERRIGAALFERTSRKVTLTPIGARLRDDLQDGYDRIQAGLDSAVEAARGTAGTLRLGLIGAQGYDLAPLTRAFRARHPGCELIFREVPFSDPFTQLRAGEVDLQSMWLPVREPDLTVGPLVLSEPMWLMTDDAHPLAARESVTLEDLADCTLPRIPDAAPAYWVEAVLPSHTPSGRPIARGPLATTFQEIEPAVLSGTTQCVVHTEATRYYRRPGITYTPIEDAPPSRWSLIWRTAGETALVRAYAQVAAELAADR